MKLNAPSQVMWLIALILGVLGIISHYRVIRIPTIFPYSFELLIAGFAILLIATVARRF